MLRVFAMFLLACAAAVAAGAQSAATPEAVFGYQGPDRSTRLIQRAKQEGTLTLYTSLAPTESQPLAAAFEKKYGVKVVLWRALSDQVVQRSVNEARARRRTMDVVETNGPEMEMLAREQVLAQIHSPYLADLPAGSIPSHRTWYPDRFNFYVVAYNTKLVQRSQIPATYEGFTDPKWKGRISVEATDAEWMATIIKTWGAQKGMDYFRRLSSLRPDVRKGHILLANLIVAGEVPIGLTTYHSNVVPLKAKGAPIDFVPVQPVVARPQGIGVARNAPHPNAALLFVDYVLSPEGQRLFESMGRVPASTRVKSQLNNFPFTVVDPVVALDEKDKWEKVWTDLFLRN